LVHGRLARAVGAPAFVDVARCARADHEQRAARARLARRAQEGVADHLRRGGVQQHLTRVGARLHLAREADRLEGACAVDADHALAREALHLAREEIADGGPRARIGEIGAKVLEARRAAAAHVDHARVGPGHGARERLPDPTRGAGGEDEMARHGAAA